MTVQKIPDIYRIADLFEGLSTEQTAALEKMATLLENKYAFGIDD